MLKRQLNLICPYCKKACGDTDEWVITKLGTRQYYHGKCLIKECRKNEHSKNTARFNQGCFSR